MPNIITRGAMSAKAVGFTGQTTTPVYVEDVFSTYLYTGNGSTQTITNNIDLSTKGGLVWIKARTSSSAYNMLFDTFRGAYKPVFSNTTDAQQNYSPLSLTSFTTSGFSLSDDASGNYFVNGSPGGAYSGSAGTYASWTFRKQPKFFDVVTYTGNGVAGRQISHSLNAAPGFIITKATNTSSNWLCYHTSLGFGAGTDTDTNYIVLNSTAASNGFGTAGVIVSANTTSFTPGASANANGLNYVAYLFANQAGGFGLSGSDSVVACGSFTGPSATINLGWEAQYVLIKRSDSINSWFIFDTMRGMAETFDAYLIANTTSSEGIDNPAWVTATASGFKVANWASGGTYIYLAIRRGPMKVPTSGTSVFSPIIWTGNNTASRQISTGLLSPPDLSITQFTNGVQNNLWWDKLRGLGTTASMVSAHLRSPVTNAETSLTQYYNTPTMTAVGFGTTSSSSVQLNGSGASVVAWNFRRAPGFMDDVCYTGTGSPTTVAHNLGVVPELMIVKGRNSSFNWAVYAAPLGNTKALELNNLDPPTTTNAYWNNTSPTSSIFTIGGSNSVNSSSTSTYVAYLFATCPGVSKVGGYTGTGAAQNIDCGFAAGARFILIKRTDSTGDWYTYDSAQGISSGNDPYLLLNSGAAQVTGTNYVDTFASGFTLTASAPAGLNANGGSYIFLAIA